MKKDWSSILEMLRTMLPEGDVKVFLETASGKVQKLADADRASAQGLLVDTGAPFEWEVRVSALNEFFAARISEKFTQAIAQAAQRVLGGRAKVTVKASSARAKAEMPKPVNAEELAKSIPSAPAPSSSSICRSPACAPSIPPAPCAASAIRSTTSWWARAISSPSPPPPTSSTPTPPWT